VNCLSAISFALRACALGTVAFFVVPVAAQTPAKDAPQVWFGVSAVTLDAIEINQGSATLRGRLGPTPADGKFQYGRTATYGNESGYTYFQSVNDFPTLSTPISGLQCGTTYHFRVYASRCEFWWGPGPIPYCQLHEAFGEDKSFTTAACTPPGSCSVSVTPSALPTSGGTVQVAASCASGSPATSWTWSRNGIAIGGTAASFVDTLPAITLAGPQTYTYTATACNSGGCSPAASAAAIVPNLTPVPAVSNTMLVAMSVLLLIIAAGRIGYRSKR
jgi:hypothetical protein